MRKVYFVSELRNGNYINFRNYWSRFEDAQRIAKSDIRNGLTNRAVVTSCYGTADHVSTSTYHTVKGKSTKHTFIKEGKQIVHHIRKL